jgi:antitoxin (DNA-binding transcriptional repressor) of toxin-antitoxin stability system
MSQKITATNAVRRFSEILSAVTYQGASYTVLRGGKPVAEIRPVGREKAIRTLRELPEILMNVPRLGKEGAAFENDLRWVVSHQPAPAKRGGWE